MIYFLSLPLLLGGGGGGRMKMKTMNTENHEIVAAPANPNPDFNPSGDETKPRIKSFQISDPVSEISRTTANSLPRNKFQAKDKFLNDNTSDCCCHKRGFKSQPSARRLATSLWRARISNVDRRCHDLSHPQHSAVDMEGATKWDTCSHLWDEEKEEEEEEEEEENKSITTVKAPYMKTMLSSLGHELVLAKARIRDLESEKTKNSVRKTGEEEGIRKRALELISTLKSDLRRERRAGRRLAAELSSAEFSMKRLAREYEREKKAKQVMEQVCEELAREMGEDKAEIEAIKQDSMRLQEEAEEERRMIQMAEVWREEQVQMKLSEAGLLLQHKYDRLSHLIDTMESFLDSRVLHSAEDSSEARVLLRAAAALRTAEEEAFSCRGDGGLATAQNGDGRTGGLSRSGRSSNASAGQGRRGSLSRLWKSGGQREGARLSNGSTASADRSGMVWNLKEGSPAGSADSGRKRAGCLEWPCSVNHNRGSTKVKLVQQVKHVDQKS